MAAGFPVPYVAGISIISVRLRVQVNKTGQFTQAVDMDIRIPSASLLPESHACGRTVLQRSPIAPSMSRKGNPYDNAMAENFFSILKTEYIYRHKPRSFDEANKANPDKDRSGAADATPLHLKLNIPT